MNNNSFAEIYGNNGIRIALVGVLAILALFLLAATITMASKFGRSGMPATDTITVQGNGQAAVVPEVAKISFTVMHTASTVSAAQEATTKQSNAVLAYVKGEGIADKDVKTLSYNISPQYSYPNPCPPGATVCPAYIDSPKITGYQVAQTVQVTVRDLTKVGTMFGKLGALEVQNLNGPDFGLDDPTAAYNAARADAIAKAKAQAQVLAGQLGVRLGKIVNFSESSGGYPYPMREAYGMGGGDTKAVAAPNVPVGENTYNASVSITYEIR